MGGWLGAIGSIFSWIGGESVTAAIARVAIGLGISKLLNKTNESAAGSTSASTPQGTRQQISPATDNKAPVAYGDSYFSGTIIDVKTANSNKEMFAVLDLCEITGDIFSTGLASNITIDDIYLNNQRVTFRSNGTTVAYTTDDTGVQDDNAADLCGIYLFNGSSNNPVLPCQTGTTTPISGTVPPVAYEIMPGWDNTYTNQNKVFAIVKINYDPSKGLHSLPTLKFHVRNTLNKPGDVLHDYMTNVMYGAGLPESAIDTASITALNSYSDEMVTLGIYPAQPRYRINGLVRTTETVFSNMERLAAAAGSYISNDISTGKWSIIINKPTAKTLDFDDSNILGQIAVSGSNLDAAYNKVEVQFPYKVLKDQYNYVRFDLPEIFMNANEPANTMQITHEFVNDVVQATILANLDLRQSREDLVVTFKTDYSKYNVGIGAVIGVTNEVYGWSGKKFKVIRIKKNESDSGQLTLEVTAQSYNEDVYTVEDITDFVPLIGVGHSLPSLTPIARPVAPTVTSTTLSSQPAVFITGTVPEGVVTEMEFWFTSDTNPDDDARPYTLLGTMRNENGGPFTIGATTGFKSVLLATGNYYFKVRANNNGTSTSRFSPPSAPLAYTYVQAPDVLKYTTPTVDDNGIAADDNGMSIGLMAGYLAYKLFEDEITDYVKDIFGITDEQAAKANEAVVKDKTAQTQASDAIVKASDAQTTADSAAQSAAAADAKATAALAAVEALNLPPVPVEKSSTIGGHVFPTLFGEGPLTGSSTRAGIFTHDHLVFGGGAASLELLPENIVTSATNLSIVLRGTFQNFYNLPGAASFSQKPFYDETGTNKFDVGTRVTLYYSTCSYSSGRLDEQAWSAWKKLADEDGVTGSAPYDPVVVWTNPPPAPPVPGPYVIEEVRDTDGAGYLPLPDLPSIEAYDPFKPNFQKIIPGPASDTRSKDLTVDVEAVKLFEGGTQLIALGVSVFNLPDNTAFSNNTLFGHKDELYVTIFPDAKGLRQVAASSGMFVGIDASSDRVYWSTNGLEWKRIELDSDVTSEDPHWIDSADLSDPDVQIVPPFRFVVYDGSKFILYGLGDQIATSTDGKVWVEIHTSSGLAENTSHVIADSGNYLACSIYGVQTSSDGITWSPVTLPAVMNGRGPDCGVWDGSKYLVGNQHNNGARSILYSSADGDTWSAIEGLNNPHTASSSISETNQSIAAQDFRNASIVAALP